MSTGLSNMFRSIGLDSVSTNRTGLPLQHLQRHTDEESLCTFGRKSMANTISYNAYITLCECHGKLISNLP